MIKDTRQQYSLLKAAAEYCGVSFEISFIEYQSLLTKECKCGSIDVNTDLFDREKGYAKNNIFVVCNNCRRK